MTYSDVGLTSSQIAELKLSLKATAWRAKILKPEGKKLSGVDTTNIVKIDARGGGDVSTAIGRYQKMIHDEKHNRTFILHVENADEATDEIVTIVNHNLDVGHADYLEKINATTSAGWPNGYVGPVLDMEYCVETETLAISVPGAGTLYPPALCMIDMDRQLDSLKTGTCNELEDNPDYLACTVWSGGATIVGLANCNVEIVRYYQSRWWTWTKLWAPGTDYHWYQLGFFNQQGSYTLIQTWGQTGGSGLNNAAGDPYVETTTYPTMPRGDRNFVSDPACDSDLYVCDPVAAFENVTNIIIVDGGAAGTIIMTTRPTAVYQVGFGTEACIIKIDIATLLANYAGPTPVATMQWSEAAYWDDEDKKYKIDAGTFITSGVDLSAIKGYCRVKCTQAHTGSKAGDNLLAGSILYVQGTNGTAKTGGDIASGDTQDSWNLSTFCYEESAAQIGIGYGDVEDDNDFTVIVNVAIYEHLPGMNELLGVHTADAPIVQDGDSDRPTTGTCSALGATWRVASRFASATYTKIYDCYYSTALDKYVFPVVSEAGTPTHNSLGGLGLWAMSCGGGAKSLAKHKATNSNLVYDACGTDVNNIGDQYVQVASVDTDEDNLSVQFFEIETETFMADADGRFDAALIYTYGGNRGVIFDSTTGMVGFCTGDDGVLGSGEAWYLTPETTSGKWSRDPRVWWDGSGCDVLMGAGTADSIDLMGQNASFQSPQFSQSKGSTSYRFSFTVSGEPYLPWVESIFNQNASFPNLYDGTLKDGARIVLERGIYDASHQWQWIQEGLFYIVEGPASAGSGIAEMSITATGAIGLLVTRATHIGTYEPTTTSYSGITLASGDGYIYSYDPGAGVVTDWRLKPEPIIYIDGVKTTGYALNTSSGLVTFGDDKSGNTITATFDAWDAGSNEAEDIIWCILTDPNELGGCGLDETFITRNISGETLTTSDNLTYVFSKNMIRADGYNVVYIDGVPATPTVDYNWNDGDTNPDLDSRSGTVTFAVSQAGKTITGDCTYYTIQKSGVTLRPISFHPRKQKNSYDCCQEVMRQVAPNYIMREGRDGKVECDFFTQAAAGSEDIAIDSEDIVVDAETYNPAYNALATRVISFGQAGLSELPDLCLGKPVTDNWTVEATAYGWPRAWHTGADITKVVDGDPVTGVTSGWGRWSEGTLQVNDDITAAGETGVPCLTVDMEAEYEVCTIIIARPSGASKPIMMRVQNFDIFRFGFMG